MKRRIRQHVNPLKMSSLVSRDAWVSLPTGRIIEVELGCGDAQFLLQLAQKLPDRHFFGLDIRGKILEEALFRTKELGLGNLELLPSNLIVDLGKTFPPGSIRRFFINFPDPWFKRRHHNRRWLTPESVQHLIDALDDQGEVFFQSDVWSVAIEALALFEANDHLLNANTPWSFLRFNPYPARSEREEACMEQALPIWRMLFKKIPPPPVDH